MRQAALLSSSARPMTAATRTELAEAARAMTPTELAGLKRIRAMGDIQAGEIVHPEAKTLRGADFPKAYPEE